MKIAYVTPTHDPKYLDAVYFSLRNQTDPDWEWHIFMHPEIEIKLIQDERVHYHRLPFPDPVIGKIKNYSFMNVETADILVELDHDDTLRPDANAKIREAFQDESIGFVYSDCARFSGENAQIMPYDASYGWTYRKEGQLNVPNSFPLVPATLGFIWYAPDHLRAWRRSVYVEVGGHNPEMVICDDHDLVIRTYLATNFHHIPECLYLYREHQNNSYRIYNAAIQTKTVELFHKYIYRIAMRWADINNLLCLDLCSGPKPAPGYAGIDKRLEEGGGQHDLDEGIPLPDNTVGVVRAWDALEHLKSPVKTMNEIHRVLAHGGMLLSETPSTDGRGAFQDPTHISFWNSNSFWYYTNKQLAQYVPEITCRFQATSVQNYFPSEFCKQHNIVYVQAYLTALKSDVRLPGINNWSE